MVTTINDALQETSPHKGLASSGYFPAKGTCSASLPSRAFLYTARVLLRLRHSELGLPLHLPGCF